MSRFTSEKELQTIIKEEVGTLSMKDGDLCIITEVGVFADLNITDPTMKKVNKDNPDLQAVIEQAISDNEKNLV